MAEHRRPRLDLARLLSAVEDAPPVAAADVLGEQLADTLGATDVAFLIADFSGEALIRLGQSGSDGGRSRRSEAAQRVSLAEAPYGRVLAGQHPELVHGDDGIRVVAPVTNRGEAIGVLEACCRGPRMSARWPTSRWLRTRSRMS